MAAVTTTTNTPRETITYTRRREQTETRICEQCEQPYVGIARSRYCGLKCKQKAAYARHPDERRAAKRSARKQKRDSTPTTVGARDTTTEPTKNVSPARHPGPAADAERGQGTRTANRKHSTPLVATPSAEAANPPRATNMR
jgi:hypothetical protein